MFYFVIVVNLLLCLTEYIKIYHRYTCIGKNISTGSGTICGFRHPLGLLEHVSCGLKGTSVFMKSSLLMAFLMVCTFDVVSKNCLPNPSYKG